MFDVSTGCARGYNVHNRLIVYFLTNRTKASSHNKTKIIWTQSIQFKTSPKNKTKEKRKISSMNQNMNNNCSCSVKRVRFTEYFSMAIYLSPSCCDVKASWYGKQDFAKFKHDVKNTTLSLLSMSTWIGL